MPINNNNTMELTHSKFSLKKTKKKNGEKMRLGIMVVLVIIGLAILGSFPKRVEGVFGIQMDPCTHSACTEAYIYIYIYICMCVCVYFGLFKVFKNKNQTNQGGFYPNGNTNGFEGARMSTWV